MTAICQYCQALIVGPETTAESSAERKQFAYRQLSMLVSLHMQDQHAEEIGKEMHAAMLLAAAAVAMRWVASNDAALDAERVAAGDFLVAAFQPSPVEPLVSLA